MTRRDSTNATGDSDAPAREEDVAAYCRDIEAYLCRKNDGHLVRIVGPAFEQVCGWAARGVPPKVAFGGIDRYFERYYAKGPRRRPVRIEFCEADVLDVFDEWRRALGLTSVTLTTPSGAASRTPSPAQGAGAPADESAGAEDVDAGTDAGTTGSRRSLPAHLDRVLSRLAALRPGLDAALDELIATTTRELDAARVQVRGIRGDARDALIARLSVLDHALLDAVRERVGAEALDELAAEAEAELAPFRSRLPAAAYERSRRAALDRLLRERLRLPTLSYD